METKPTENPSEEAELELGVLEYLSKVDEKMSDLQDRFDRISDESDTFQQEVMTYTIEVEDVANNASKADRKRINSIARKIAGTTSDYSDSIEEEIDPIRSSLDFVMNAIQSFIEFSDPSEKEHKEALAQLHKDMTDFIQEINETTTEMEQFQSEMGKIRGLNRELDKSIKELNENLSELGSVLNEGTSKAERFKSLIEKELEDTDEYIV